MVQAVPASDGLTFYKSSIPLHYVNETKKYTSHAKWPDGSESVDDHFTRDQAQGVCDVLRRNGYGGNGTIFPTSTWVEPREQPYDILNNGRPVATLWADSSEAAIEIFNETFKSAGKITAVERLHEQI